MNNLLFYAILIALGYYCVVSWPQQPKTKHFPPPLTRTSSTQTETLARQQTAMPTESPELMHALTSLLHNLQDLNRAI